MHSRAPRLLLTAVAGLLALTGGVAACSAGPTVADGVDVVAGLYPLQFVAERVGASHAGVTSLAAPGAEPHDLELSPSQIGQIALADLVLYLKGLQPELDESISQNNADHALDLATVTPLMPGSQHEHEGEEEAHEEGGLDPHVWLDPMRLATVGDAVGERLAAVDPEHAAEYRAEAGRLRAELTALDEEFRAGLRSCQRHEIVTSHAAFGYLADRYGLEQIALSGLTPETEPTPQRLAQVAAEAREHGATTIFFETLVSPKVADTLAAEVGAKTAVLDPLEGPPAGAGGDYFSAMRANLETLRTALGCV
jgi:zinc transport system substrate-binding protein